ncbi:MAG: hypothetical protein HQL49_09830 [Gammaproteobacteria bacterium]|nr:hypothetical protein [Gammaproteobacteria bacterium]
MQLNRQTWHGFWSKLKQFGATPEGSVAKRMLAGIIIMLLVINGFNVVNSYVGRDFMTSIEQRDMSEFRWQTLLYIIVFTLTTLVAVSYRYLEERLGLLWRQWLTAEAISRYLDQHTFYRMHLTSSIAKPDQRITEDIRELPFSTLSFLLIILNATLTVFAFSGVMWSISPALFLVAILYAILGSLVTIYLGKPLVRLNYIHLDREANLRSDLVEVRENSESIALLQRERRLNSRLMRHLQDLVDNAVSIINVNRNMGFFTTGFNYMIQIIPALVVAPLFIQGDAPFGIIAQSAIAFGHLLGAFSVIINIPYPPDSFAGFTTSEAIFSRT